GPRRTPGGAVDAAIALGFRHYGFAAEAGGRKFTSQVAEIATTWAGSVTLWIRGNNSYNLRAGVTPKRARTVLLPTFLELCAMPMGILARPPVGRTCGCPSSVNSICPSAR